ncbi:acyl-CoA dehydrogenase [Pelagibius litoralis]|uniref:Acyl-CoA dehydrogenase n=1 Tax=Pelagibius litoralis TaxID=374515 RepID=A0A967EW25_9PROT|nr:MaoC family dehydratase N-terminal domain-containing protein [Pelagibius litoralis]NIA69064.1 acyl-CoA dehydrogenase [Pelagibius litoralis]
MSGTNDDWSDWVGRQEEACDSLDLNRARALQATLDDSGAVLEPGAALPPLWHWAYFWSLASTAGLGPDGHAARGEFLPPIDLPRRMWAGSRVVFPKPLAIGSDITRRSTIKSVAQKIGRSGPLAFVTVEHVLDDGAGLCVVEEHDIVYREAAAKGAALPPGKPAPADGAWVQNVSPSPVLLFRYSALTFNGHRIHYDQPYTTQEEGYPGLIVHGPLLATLMVGLVRREEPAARVTRFAFRALRPIFDTRPFTVCGAPDGRSNRADLWVTDHDGFLAMQGEVDWA